MNDRRTQAVSLAAAVAIVGAALFVLLRHATPIVEMTPAASPAVVAPAPAASPPAAGVAPNGPAIYRCKVRASIVYSDTPCEGGKVVDVQPTRGYEMPRGAGQRAPVAIAKAAPSATPTVASSSEASSANECRYLDEQIANSDVAARAGGTAPVMDDLRERRRKLVDRRYELRC